MNFVCLNAGNYQGRGAEYVNNLAAMIGRHYHADFKLFCLTDDPKGLDPRIDVIELPADLEKWWGKLYLFKDGVLPKGERVCYLDLDTLIVGQLDAIAAYRGDFATLQDFYWPHLVGPAVMLWEAGKQTQVWDEWEQYERPSHPMGDLWWLNTLDDGKFIAKADRLQLLYPYSFISFKVHCNPDPIAEASVICFHGQPKVTDLPEGHWARGVWKQ